MNELMKFEFEGKPVRTITNENRMTEWLGKDVAEALGYKDPGKAIRNHCKADGRVIRPLIDSKGRIQEAVYINEPNLFRLITHSKLELAIRFEKWVFETVLPSIRSQGGYIKINATSDQIANLQAQLHNALIETKHYKMIAEDQERAFDAYGPKVRFGQISLRNGLPRMLKRRSTYVADPSMKISPVMDELQLRFGF